MADQWGATLDDDYEDAQENTSNVEEHSVDYESMAMPDLKHSRPAFNKNSKVGKNQNQSSVKVNNSAGFQDPYAMKPTKVRTQHFYDGRAHDPDTEAGFQVQRMYARRAYRNWLTAVRRQPGWGDFRRDRPEPERIDRTVTWVGWGIGVTHDQHGRPFDAETVAFNLSKITDASERDKFVAHARGRAAHQTASATIKGVKITDEEYRAKTFTRKMGLSVAEHRLGLNKNQEQLALLANIDVATLRAIERGDHPYNPQDVVVKNLAKALGLPTIKYQE